MLQRRARIGVRPARRAPSLRCSGPAGRLSMKHYVTAAAMAALLTGAAGVASAADWFPYSVEVWDPPFNMASPRKTVDYTPLPKADKPFEICVSFPHMKDAY